VSQQHAEGDAAAAGVGFSTGVDQEFREDADDGGIEFEEAAFVEDGCSG
jgi:hypothetical protein